MASLTWHDDEGVEHTLILTGEVILGRDEGCDISTNNPSASRRHCAIRPTEDGGYEVHDLGSSHGTDVGNRRVTSHRLRDGDRVVCGPGFAVTYYDVP